MKIRGLAIAALFFCVGCGPQYSVVVVSVPTAVCWCKDEGSEKKQGEKGKKVVKRNKAGNVVAGGNK